MTLSRRQMLSAFIGGPAIYYAMGERPGQANPVDFEDCGVTSGHPTPDGFVIWTRLPPVARSKFGPTEVHYEINTSPAFLSCDARQRGVVFTDASKDFTVRHLAKGLDPYTTYYYRFWSGPYVSVTGRAKTAASAHTPLHKMSIAVVTCQKFSDGYYTALAALNQEPVDFCIHLGDHIYEKETGTIRPDEALGGEEATTLDQYRLKYRHYLSDPNYREARRRFTWIDLWDDHEVYNDYAGDRDRAHNMARVAAAYQAYAEYMPLNTEFQADPNLPPSLSTFNSLSFGSLVELIRLDERQYRKPNACSRTFVTPRCPEAEALEQSMLGAAQLTWLKDTLGGSKARWKLLLNQVMLTPLKVRLLNKDNINEKALESDGDKISLREEPASSGTFLNLDAWDGYPAERQHILEFVKNEQISSVVAITGDIHASAHAKLLLDGQSASAKPTAFEVVVTSITSSSLEDRLGPILGSGAGLLIKKSNPHMQWSDLDAHGYAVITVTEDTFESRHVNVTTVAAATSQAKVAKTLVLPHGFNV